MRGDRLALVALALLTWPVSAADEPPLDDDFLEFLAAWDQVCTECEEDDDAADEQTPPKQEDDKPEKST